MKIVPLRPKAFALFVFLVGISLFRVPTYSRVSGYDIFTQHQGSWENFAFRPLWDMDSGGHIDLTRLGVTWLFFYLVALATSRLFWSKGRVR